MLLMLLGLTYKRDKRFIVLHGSENCYYAECFEILSLRSH